jgi:hypothetical protein
MWVRLGAGLLFAAGYFVLVYDFLTIGRRVETRVSAAPALGGSAGD